MNAKRSDKGANALLGDLESIRTLLSEEEKAAQTATDPAEQVDPADPRVSSEPPDAQSSKDAVTSPEDEVPLLDDVIDGAVDVAESTAEPDLEQTSDLEQPSILEQSSALEQKSDLEKPSEIEQQADPKPAPGVNQTPEPEEEKSQIMLDDEMFNRLLGDDWRQAAAGLLDDARSAIEEHSQHWTPQDTDELNEALQVRIDETLHRWLRRTVQKQMDDLQAELLRAIGDQLEITVRRRFNDAQPDEGAHGK